jgi:hypothetical protein
MITVADIERIKREVWRDYGYHICATPKPPKQAMKSINPSYRICRLAVKSDGDKCRFHKSCIN